MKLSTMIRSLTLLTLLSILIPGTATAVQQALPDGDTLTGAWTTTPLWSALNIPGDTTNSVTTTTDGDLFEVSLGPISTPSDSGAACNLIITQMSTGTGGPERYDWALLDGDSGTPLVASNNVSATNGAWQTSTIAVDLSATPPSDWGNIAVTITSASIGAADALFMGAIHLECLDPAAATVPALSSPTTTGIDTTFTALGATIDSDGGNAITARGTVWNATGTPITENILAEGGTTTEAFSHLRGTGDGTGTPMPAGALIFYRGYAANGIGTGYSPDGSFYTEPTVASDVTIDNITGSSMRINWLNGSNTTALVLVKQGSSVDASPSDGSTYTANTIFTSGDQIGTNNYVVFAASGTSVTVSGLSASTIYHVAVYAYAGSGIPINYQQDSPATGTATTIAGASLPTLSAPTAANIDTTLATLGTTVDTDGGDAITARGTVWNTTGAPITENVLAEGGTTTGTFTHLRGTGDGTGTPLPAGTLTYYRGYATNGVGTGFSPDNSFYTEPTTTSNVSIDNITGTSMRINWANGSNTTALVLVKEGTAVDAPPVDGTTYTANTTFASGDQIVAGNYVVFTASGTSVTIFGLSNTTTYHVSVYAYAGSGLPINYQQDNPAIGNATTTAGSASIPVLSGTTVYWTQLNRTSSVKDTTAKLGATIDSDGSDTITERGIVWNTTGTPTIADNKFIEGGTAVETFTANVTGLTKASLIYFRGYATNSQGTGYSPEATFYSEPDAAAAPTVDAPTGTNYFDLTVHYTKPANADGILVVARPTFAPSTPPYDGLIYSASSRVGAGDTTEPGCIIFCEYVVADDTASGSVTVTGLKDNSNQYFTVYAYKGSGAGISGINYVQTITATGPTITDTVPAAGKSHNELNVAQGGLGGTMTSADCANCHGAHHTAQLLPTGIDMYNKCFSCHQAGGAADDGTANAKINIGLHLADGSVDCGTCHSMHSFKEEELYSTSHSGTKAFNLSFVRSNMSKYLNTTNGFPVDALVPTVFQNRPGDFAFQSTDPPYNAICQTCHSDDTRTSHHQQDATDDHNFGADCISCHSHKSSDEYNAFEPSGGHTATDFAWDATTKVSCGAVNCHDWFNNQDVAAEIHNGRFVATNAAVTNNCMNCHDNGSGGSQTTRLGSTDGDGDAKLASAGPRGPGKNLAAACTVCHIKPLTEIHHATILHTMTAATAQNGACVTCHMPNVGAQSPLANRTDIMMPANLACNWCHLWWPNNTDYIDQGTDNGYDTTTVTGKVMIYRLTWDPVPLDNQRTYATTATLPSHAISENATTPINDYGACFACHGATGADTAGRADEPGADMIRPFHGLGNPVTSTEAWAFDTGSNADFNMHLNNFFAGPQQQVTAAPLKTDPYHPSYAALNWLNLEVSTNQGGKTKPYATDDSTYKFIHDSERLIRCRTNRNTAIGTTSSSIEYNNWGTDLGGVGSVTVNSGGLEGSSVVNTTMPLVNLSLPTSIGAPSTSACP